MCTEQNIGAASKQKHSKHHGVCQAKCAHCLHKNTVDFQLGNIPDDVVQVCMSMAVYLHIRRSSKMMLLGQLIVMLQMLKTAGLYSMSRGMMELVAMTLQTS